MPEFFSLLLSIAAIVLVLYLCYRASKFLSGKINSISSSNNVKIHERALLGQDKGLAVIEVCGKFYLIGFSSTNIDILKELDNYVPKAPDVQQPEFMNMFKDAVKKINIKKPGEKKKDEESDD